MTGVRNLIFKCPNDLENKEQYLIYLGQENSTEYPGLYQESRLPKSNNRIKYYRVFTSQGDIKIPVAAEDYTLLTETSGGAEGKSQDFWGRYSGAQSLVAYRTVAAGRQGFTIKVKDKRYPLRLLMQKLFDRQRDPVLITQNAAEIEVRDNSFFEPEDFESGAYQTVRKGFIEKIETGENGDGVYSSGNTCPITGVVAPTDDPPLFYCYGFSLTFMETRLRRLY